MLRLLPNNHHQFINIGRVVGSFRLDGTVKVEILTDFEERFSKGSVLYIRREPFEVLNSFRHKQQFRLKLKGIDNVNAVEELLWEFVQVPLQNRPHLEKGEYYVQDLIDLEVFDQNGNKIGNVQEIIPNPAHDLLKVNNVLIPAVSAFVKKIDLNNGRIDVYLIPGMQE